MRESAQSPLLPLDPIATRSLRELPVLVVDCQTTGGTPPRGEILDIGWCVTRACDPAVSLDDVTHHLVAPTGDGALPRSITRLTGIETEDLADAVSQENTWCLIRHTVGREDLTAGGASPFAMCVAHYARFEGRFLQHLHRRCAPGSPFPLRFLCTHEIGRRLHPDIPRRGLRALAGYLGYSLPEQKRAAAHVVATAQVWSHLVGALANTREIRTLGELAAFLSTPPPARAGKHVYALPRARRLALPHSPGVYRFLAADGRILYVGKATSLRARVNSYFRKRRGEDKILELVTQVHDVAVTPTGSCLEAALLEHDEITRHTPPYNRALRIEGKDTWYVTADLSSVLAAPDHAHHTGPLPGQELPAQLRALSEILAEGDRNPSNERAREVGLPPSWIEDNAFASGVYRFREAHAIPTPCADALAALRAIGVRICRDRIRERANEDAPETDASTPPELVLTPEHPRSRLDADGVCGTLENLAVVVTRLVRRARWFNLLADAAVEWTPADRPAADPTRLELAGGTVVTMTPAAGSEDPITWRERAAPTRSAPRSPGRPLAVGRTTYDRLRVLTTELRRLVGQGREVRVYLPTGRVLSTHALCRLLEVV